MRQKRLMLHRLIHLRSDVATPTVCNQRTKPEKLFDLDQESRRKARGEVAPVALTGVSRRSRRLRGRTADGRQAGKDPRRNAASPPPGSRRRRITIPDGRWAGGGDRLRGPARRAADAETRIVAGSSSELFLSAPKTFHPASSLRTTHSPD